MDIWKTGTASNSYLKHRYPIPLDLLNDIQNLVTEKLQKPFETVVDVGCGPGISSRAIADFMQPQKLIGLDISSIQIQTAQEQCAADNIEYRQQNIIEAGLPFADNSVDLITASESFHYLTDDNTLAELKRVLKLNGMLAILTSTVPRISVIGIEETEQTKNVLKGAVDKIFYAGTAEVSAKYKFVVEKFESVNFPFTEKIFKPGYLDRHPKQSLSKFMDYCRTCGSIQCHSEEKQDQLLEECSEKIKSVAPQEQIEEGIELSMTMDWYLIAFRKHI